MTIRDAIGEQTRERSARTRPGVLARFVNEWLYSGHYQEPESKHGSRMYRIYDSARCAIDDRNEHAVRQHGITSDKNDVETVLRAIRDYLEEMAFSEVIP